MRLCASLPPSLPLPTRACGAVSASPFCVRRAASSIDCHLRRGGAVLVRAVAGRPRRWFAVDAALEAVSGSAKHHECLAAAIKCAADGAL